MRGRWREGRGREEGRQKRMEGEKEREGREREWREGGRESVDCQCMGVL